MASIHKRPDGRWRARYRDAADREHARHFSRKVDAQRWLDEVTTAVVTGTYVDPRSRLLRFTAAHEGAAALARRATVARDVRGRVGVGGCHGRRGPLRIPHPPGLSPAHQH